jgi:hypothetical protein
VLVDFVFVFCDFVEFFASVDGAPCLGSAKVGGTEEWFLYIEGSLTILAC